MFTDAEITEELATATAVRVPGAGRDHGSCHVEHRRYVADMDPLERAELRAYWRDLQRRYRSRLPKKHCRTAPARAPARPVGRPRGPPTARQEYDRARYAANKEYWRARRKAVAEPDTDPNKDST